MKTIFRIDNQMMTIRPGYCEINPIRRYEKQHKTTISLETTPYYTTGSKKADQIIIQRLLSGSLRVEQLEIITPMTPILK